MSDPLRLALLGCGGIMNKHAGQSAAISEVQIVGLCDTVEPNMDRLIDRSLSHMDAPPPKFDDAATMYAQTRPDAVVIATPHTLHYDHTVQALDAGCHILMEKPMVTDLKHAVDLERRVHESGKVFCIAYNTPCSVEFHKLRQMIRGKELGELKVVNLYLSQPWYYLTKGSWRQDPALSGGGQMYDSGAHALNSLCWAVEQDVAEVFAFVDQLDTAVDINGVASIKFANGTMASIAITGQGPSGAHSAWIFEYGKVELDPWNAGWINITAGSADHPKGQKVKYPVLEGADGQPLSNFVDAVLGRAEPRTTARHGVIQSQLMDAIYRSARTGQPAQPSA